MVSSTFYEISTIGHFNERLVTAAPILGVASCSVNVSEHPIIDIVGTKTLLADRASNKEVLERDRFGSQVAHCKCGIAAMDYSTMLKRGRATLVLGKDKT